MGLHIKLFVISLLLISICLQEKVFSDHDHITDDEELNNYESKNGTCSTSDLNHSLLVECNGSSCEEITNQDIPSWPKNKNEIIHIHSSRAGDRFAISLLPNLDFQESDRERTFNINTTLYVNSTQKIHEIYGFGTFLDSTIDYSSKQEIEKVPYKVYEPIFKDLFGNFNSANHLTVLSISVTRDSIMDKRVSQILLQIDAIAIKSLVPRDDEYSKIKVILNLDDLDRTLDIIEALKATAKVMSEFRVLQIWAVTVDEDWLLKNSSNEFMLGYLQELFSTKNTFARTNFSSVPDFVDAITKSQSILRGLVIKSQYQSVYNILNYVRESRKDLKILTIGRDNLEISGYGDWNTAQNYAVEIYNHLKHGSNAFLEAHSAVDILKEPYSRDCSIYSLRRSHNIHFRSPMYYALGHFSRYIVPGSKLLKSSVFTQPNMFAAHYISFITPQNFIISIILNDNEHLLPFRLAVDGHILAHVNLLPKSFNTIITKQ